MSIPRAWILRDCATYLPCLMLTFICICFLPTATYRAPSQVVEIEPHPIATDTGDNSNSNSNSNQHAAAPDAGTKHHRKRRSARGLLLLSTVPLVWGTYGPSVKYLYDMGGDAVASPPGLVFNFACCVVSALTLAGVFWINHLWRQWGEYCSIFSRRRNIMSLRPVDCLCRLCDPHLLSSHKWGRRNADSTKRAPCKVQRLIFCVIFCMKEGSLYAYSKAGG